jgi:hypothetical protein
MIAAGAAAHPCAQFCDNLVVGGFSDWYMPAQNELEICYFNLKPTTTGNNTATGINANAVPARASDYTTGNPAQTSATIFRIGNAQAFTVGAGSANQYWASNEIAANRGYVKQFEDGTKYNYGYKSTSRLVRAVRRLPV